MSENMKTNEQARCGFYAEDEFSNILYLTFTGDKILVTKVKPGFGTLPIYTRFLLRRILGDLTKKAITRFEKNSNSINNTYEIDLRATTDFKISRSFLGGRRILIQTNGTNYEFRLKSFRNREKASIVRWLLLRRVLEDPIPGNPINEKVENALAGLAAIRAENDVIYDILVNLAVNMASFFIGLVLATILFH